FLRGATGGNVVSKYQTVNAAGKRGIVPVTAKGTEGIATRAFTDHHHIGLILRLNGSDRPGIFHSGKFCHPFLLFNHLVIIDDDILSKTKYRIASIFQFKYAAPGQVLHGSNKKCRHTEYQTQAVEGIPARFFTLFFSPDCYYAERKNK